MSKVREISWPEDYCNLKRIEEFMICGICYEYMETSVMTPCSHNYCSLCIRKYLHYKAQCPACFHVFFEKDLYVNRTMDGIIQHYLQVREKLITLIEHRVVYNSVAQQQSEPPSTPPVRPARNGYFIKSPKTPKVKEVKSPKEVKSLKVKEVQESNSNTPTRLPSTSKLEASSPTVVKSPKVLPTIAKIFNTPKRKETVPQSSLNTKPVTSLQACPVCNVNVSENLLNVHLDACLKREQMSEEKEKVKPSVSKRPPLPKLVLRVMKDAELRKKMKELGLPTQGDRRTLENRFTRYTTIYNAECDKLNPRPVPDLIRQCEMEEKQERKMDSFLVSSSTTIHRFQVERNAKEEKIEEAQKNYRAANKSSFDKLIDEVRNRRKMDMAKKQTESSNLPNEEPTASSNKPTTSAESHISANALENEENSSYNPSNEIAFQDSDSDSDAPCPLQHYTSDLPNLRNTAIDSNSNSSVPASPIKRLQNSSNISEVMNNMRTEKINNIYEATTDDSTDDDVPSSPILNKSLHRKRVKLSNKSTISSPKKNVEEKESREIKARDLCNSIINDFAFDDSSNEFTNKRDKKEIKNVKVVVGNEISQKSAANKSLPLRKKDFCDSPKKFENTPVNKKNMDNLLNKTLDDFSLESINFDDFNEHVNISSTHSLGVQEKAVNGNIETLSRSSSTTVEKENDAFSANENSHQSNNESSVRRPVRKRNRPARFAESQIVEPGNRDKMKGHLSEGSQESESPDNLKNPSSDGSFKRRRGRSKMHSSNASDETQNPPKRPVRRRQAASDRN